MMSNPTCVRVLRRLFFPILILAAGGVSAASISPGGYLTCGIDHAGVTRCWGYGGRGELGDGNTLTRSAPVEVSRDFVAVDSGGDHACGLTASGGVRCWGANSHGQLGDGTTVNSAVPRDVVGLASGVKAISVGDEHSCALLTNGGVRCWGKASYGRLGDGSTSDQNTPHDVLALGAPAIAIATGSFHTCALMADHGMKCWGYNNYGQIGDGSYTTRGTAVDVSIPHDVIAMALGWQHSCALESTGGMQCWGFNTDGELGDGSTTYRALPVAVYDLGPGSGVKAIAAGLYHSCALLKDASVRCWGYGAHGQLGAGNFSDSHVPVAPSGLGTPIAQIAAGGEHTCALDASAQPWCWGNDKYGALGYEGISGFHVDVPVRVSGLDSPAVQVSLMEKTSCAVTAAGGAMCWGNNDYGQIGDGSQYGNGSSISHFGARDVAGMRTGVRQIAAGEHHACAIRQDGSVWCWGDNQYGQVGDGTAIKRITPVQVSGVGDAIAIDAGLSHSCALTTAGAVYCWGRNEHGELGDGSTDNRNTAVAVVGLGSGVAALALGESYSCALLDDGSVRCWGANTRGQLGDASVTERHVPTTIDDSDAYALLSAGGDHTCGVTVGGAAKCWGYNSAGQVGDGSTSQRTSPTPVDGMASGVSMIAAGSSHSCALQAGVLKCWGYNGYGQLGDGSTANRVLPTTISTISGAIDALELGDGRSCVVQADAARCFGYDYGSLGNGSWVNKQSVPAEIARWSWDDRIFRDGFED